MAYQHETGWTLTTEHSASSYGVPVLLHRDHNGAYAPDDPMGADTDMDGQGVVGSCFSLGDELPPLVRTYLQSTQHPTKHTADLLA